MIIPHQELSADALLGLIQAFIMREGTDYGFVEATLPEKIAQVRAQLDNGVAVILYDTLDQSFNIVFKDQLPSEERSG